MPATVRLGTCSWADEGLLKAWYPRGVSGAAARLRYYAERFDVVEVDSPYYALPDPDVTRRWAERTPDDFTFHVKAGAAMTFHEGEPTDASFAAFRGALEPLELSGKLRGVLLQYHPRFVKSAAAKQELARARGRLEPLVPLVEFRHRSWMEPDERSDTLRFLEEHGLAYVSVDAPLTRATNVAPRVAAVTHAVSVIRFHGRNAQTWNIRGGSAADRFDWMYSAEELAEWVSPTQQLAGQADEVYALFNNNRDDFAPRSAVIFRGLARRGWDRCDGRNRPAARRDDAVLSGYAAAMRVLSVVHEPTSTGGGGLFEDIVEQRGDRLERFGFNHDSAELDAPDRYDAIMVFGGAMHPDQDAEHPWLEEEAAFIREAIDHDVPLFGACLGAQLIARSMGAHVGPIATSEVGWYRVTVNDAGLADPVLGVLPGADRRLPVASLRVRSSRWRHAARRE